MKNTGGIAYKEMDKIKFILELEQHIQAEKEVDEKRRQASN